jgi:hypothetical protein
LLPAALTVWATSLPGGHVYLFVDAAGLWLIVGLGWVAVVVALAGSDFGGLVRRFALGPIVLIAALAVAISGLPLSVRFALSRPALERLPDLGLSQEAMTQAGLYDIWGFEHTEFGYRFAVYDAPTVVWGFAYSPAGAPPGPDINSESLREGDDAYRHLDGAWYIWEYVFS